MNKPIGIIITHPSPPNHLEFYFMIDLDEEITVGTFIEVPLGQRLLLGKITRIQAENLFYHDPNFVQSFLAEDIQIHDRFLTQGKHFRYALVNAIRIIEENNISPPELPPEPGEPVYRASEQTLVRIFGSAKKGITVGTLRKTPHLVSLEISKILTQHLLIAGNTGSGKTNAAGIIVSNIVKLGFPVLIIDPHGEYKRIVEKQQLKYQIYQLPRNGIDETSNILTIQFNKLLPDQIVEISGISGPGEDLIHLTYQAFQAPTQSEYSIEEFIQQLQDIAKQWRFHTNTITATTRRLLRITQSKLLGEGLNIHNMINAGQVTVIDLSYPTREAIRRVITGYIVETIFQGRRQKILPVPTFIIIEEAHRFMPKTFRSYSGLVIQRIAREGRKFGVGLGIISQMIRNLDPVSITQCNTKIIFRLSSRSELEALIPPGDTFTKSEAHMIPYLSNGTAFVTGIGLVIDCLVEFPLTIPPPDNQDLTYTE